MKTNLKKQLINTETLKNNNFIFLDLEFGLLEITNINERKGRNKFKSFEILEVGYSDLNSEIEFDKFIKPKFKKYKINEKVKEITGIKEKNLREGISIYEFYKKFKQDFELKNTKIVTWGNKDYEVLKRVFERNRFDVFFEEEDFIDLSDYYHEINFLNKEELFSLKKVADELNIVINKPIHRAFTDSEYTKEIFKKIVN